MPFVHEAQLVKKAFQTVIHQEAWKTKAGKDIPERDAIFAGDETALLKGERITLSEVQKVEQHAKGDVLVSRRWEDARK